MECTEIQPQDYVCTVTLLAKHVIILEVLRIVLLAKQMQINLENYASANKDTIQFLRPICHKFGLTLNININFASSAIHTV